MEQWHEEFCKVLFKHRIKSTLGFGDRVKRGKAYNCSSHFQTHDIYKSSKTSWLNFGALSTEHLPSKTFQDKPAQKRTIIVRY